jgi:hypothetical protein
MAPDARWWEEEPPPRGPSEVNKYIDRCLDFLLTPESDAPVLRIAAQPLCEAAAASKCDNCGRSVDRMARVRNPYCTSHTFHMCPACWPARADASN